MPRVTAAATSKPIALGPSWLDPEVLIEAFGMLGVLAIVFVESGLLVGFFLPGDSLLFTAGLLSANDVLPDLWVLLVTIPIAAIAGDQVGYAIGRKAGPSIFNRPESRFFHKENVARAQEFFDRHGPRTIVLARFVPIVRTIAPFVAGMGVMTYSRFMFFNLIGAVLWVGLLIPAGYFFGSIPVVKANFELVILGIIGISVLPIVIEGWRARRSADNSAA